MGEITWREGMGEPSSTRTFLVVVENDVNRGTEGVPDVANPGNITLTGTIAASNLSGTNTGDQDLSGLAPIVHTHVVADIVSVASQRLIGRHTGGNGAAQEVGVGNGLEFQGSGIRRSALTGDVTAAAGSNATTIANDAVTNAKLANMATATIKGRTTAGTGDPEDLTAAQALALIGAATPASVSTQISGIIRNEGGGIVVIGTSNPTASGANTGVDSFISGTSNNSNSGNYCSISGFNNNSNSGSNCSISGRANYTNSGTNCSISGRFNHTNSGNYSLISGRDNYSNSGDYCSISGFNNHSNTGDYCQISGSYNTSNRGSHCQISGYNNNTNYGNYCQISGYNNNTNYGNHCQISGYNNYSNSGRYCQFSGYYNTSNTGSYCQISGQSNYSNSGSNCQISGYYNTSNSGSNCQISGYSNTNNTGGYCQISGENNHSNSGSRCQISGRDNRSNTGSYCQISGFSASSNALSYARVHGGTEFSRIIDVVAKAATTNATPTTLTLGGAAEDSTNRINIPANSTWSFTTTVVARETATANAKTFTRRGLIGNNGGAVTISALDTIGTDCVLGTLAATVAITADDANDALKIVGTGVVSKNIKWTAQVNITQVG
jgi:hypothetical protein